VHGQRGDVGRPDDPPDRQRGAQLIAALIEIIAQQRRGALIVFGARVCCDSHRIHA